MHVLKVLTFCFLTIKVFIYAKISRLQTIITLLKLQFHRHKRMYHSVAFHYNIATIFDKPSSFYFVSNKDVKKDETSLSSFLVDALLGSFLADLIGVLSAAVAAMTLSLNSLSQS
jgi:hypothetical protein